MDEQTSGTGAMREKVAERKDTVMEKAKSGISTVKDAAMAAKDKVMTAKEAVTAFADEAKKQDLQGNAKQAMQTMGHATREVTETAKTEVQQTKESIQGSGSTDTTSTY